ncbi:hypothetical protein COO91_04526 [Nostoc flagelliforme CCNUN1]|uniref:Uncharacterized protein n=1 Tax=Nostoc flagelliforme CCNUN1 TaxID=2038116 RepID=A0A2K8SSY3_9NOSO|nr:hypothetical protein COO91_04526 [Nostoc flagelliforme CCNUN1]
MTANFGLEFLVDVPTTRIGKNQKSVSLIPLWVRPIQNRKLLD